MKRPITITLLVLPAAGVFALVLAFGCKRTSAPAVQLPVVEPVTDPTGQLDQAFPDQKSQVTITVRIPFNQLSTLAEGAVPSSFKGGFGVPDTEGFSGIRVNPDLTRGSLGLKPVVSKAPPPKVGLDFPLNGRVGVSAFKWIIFDVTPLGPRVKTKSPDVSATFAVAGRVRGWVAPGIDAGWGFTHSQEVKVEVTQAET